MTSLFRQRRSRITAWSIAAGLLYAFGVLSTSCFAQTYWEMTPYKVRIVLALDPVAAQGTHLAEDLPAQLLERIDNSIGGAWQATVQPAIGAQRIRLLEHLDEVNAAELGELEAGLDKWIALTVDRSPEGYRVRAREYDVRTQLWSASVSATAAQLPLLHSLAFTTLWNAFSPLGQIELDPERKVVLRPRAAGLSLRDPNLRMIEPGDLFQPVIRRLDRQGKTSEGGIQAIPWTYISIEKVDGMSAVATTISGLRQALGARRRGQSEQLALAVHPFGGSTRLTVVDRSEDSLPLPGYDVYAQIPGAKDVTLVGRTDTRGQVEVHAIPESTVRILYIKGGGMLLARLPMVPGLLSEATAEVADDANRLTLEGYLVSLNNNLIDLVARREILMARIRNRIEAGKFEEAEAFLDELRRIPDRGKILLAIQEERNRNQASDPRVQQKIDMLVGESQKTVRRFLDPAPIDAIRSELNQASKVSAKAPEPPQSPAEGRL